MTSVTVRLRDSGKTQSELQKQLQRIVLALEKRGFAHAALVEAVFPGEESGKWKTTFVVSVDGAPQAFTESLRKMPGVEAAYEAPSRSYQVGLPAFGRHG